MHDIIVELVAGLIMLTVLAIIGAISFGAKVKSAISEHREQLGHLAKDVQGLDAKSDRIERESKEGRKKIYDTINAQNDKVLESINRLKTDVCDQLKEIAQTLSDFRTEHAKLLSRVDIMDRRGTQYHQSINDRQGIPEGTS